MNALYLESTEDSPKVFLDYSSGKLSIVGRSFMEDTAPFHQAIVGWLRTYFQSPQKETFLDLEMEYLNTSSTKMLLDILFELNKFFIFGNKIMVRWKYDPDDEDMAELGKEIADMVDVPFEHVVYS
ncbi:DUF1987 domain-containing protein [Fulvivirga maritima]|uniref:DUF1987 domain-containing protein n=1 Tax=Fulvivirga maritima TaxID=2904247 RepID=UPI001F1633E9|nr:DUF1987 domain-containing protein [Fulvivirga maritima]UII28707.1 DUF1987 domain-containing protein [Fulvivirga maritima]